MTAPEKIVRYPRKDWEGDLPNYCEGDMIKQMDEYYQDHPCNREQTEYIRADLVPELPDDGGGEVGILRESLAGVLMLPRAIEEGRDDGAMVIQIMPDELRRLEYVLDRSSHQPEGED